MIIPKETSREKLGHYVVSYVKKSENSIESITVMIMEWEKTKAETYDGHFYVCDGIID